VLPWERQSSHQIRKGVSGMREFFVNVTRYPRYLIAFSLGVMNSVAEPLARRRSNPVTAVALTGALISGAISMGLVLRAMVTPSPLA
jgi:hypothetical protein